MTFKEEIEKENNESATRLGFSNVEDYYQAVEKCIKVHGFVITDELILRFKQC